MNLCQMLHWSLSAGRLLSSDHTLAILNCLSSVLCSSRLVTMLSEHESASLVCSATAAVHAFLCSCECLSRHCNHWSLWKCTFSVSRVPGKYWIPFCKISRLWKVLEMGFVVESPGHFSARSWKVLKFSRLWCGRRTQWCRCRCQNLQKNI